MSEENKIESNKEVKIEKVKEEDVKTFTWLDKGPYRYKGLTLAPNIPYDVPEDISAKLALRVKRDFGDLVKLNNVTDVDEQKEELEGMHECIYVDCTFEADSTQGLSSHHAAHERKKDKKKKKYKEV